MQCRYLCRLLDKDNFLSNFLHTKGIPQNKLIFFLIIWFDACLVCLALTDPIITTWPWAVWSNVRLCIQPCCLVSPAPPPQPQSLSVAADYSWHPATPTAPPGLHWPASDKLFTWTTASRPHNHENCWCWFWFTWQFVWLDFEMYTACNTCVPLMSSLGHLRVSPVSTLGHSVCPIISAGHEHCDKWRLCHIGNSNQEQLGLHQWKECTAWCGQVQL